MKPYTVIFYVDGDYRVHTFVEHVMADSQSEAFDNAVRQAQEHVEAGCDLGYATEIVTYEEHLQPA